jgi:hypothetical protein
MLKVITPTGGRPEALNLLNSYLERQTYQDFQWIVLDDCEPVSEIPSRCDVFIQSDWIWNGENTQHRAMARLLDEVGKNDSVIVCEDDDWYAPEYIEKTANLLQKHDLVGQKKSLYYNIQNKTYRKFNHKDHACLCQTALKGKAVEKLREICRKSNKPIDITLWQSFKGHLTAAMDVVGIKGLKGRGGIGIGHKMEGKKDDWSYLESIIGKDVTNYRKRFFICASGGSLTQEDVDYIKGKGTVIVINNTFQLAPWADIVYACDVPWWKKYPEALDHQGQKMSILYDHPKVKKWPYDNTRNGIGLDRIRTGGNSGHQCINLAYLLGANEIILLGYDMQNTNGKSHWHGDHVKGLNQQTCFSGWINHMRIVAQDCERLGVKVYNCSRQTALECFERRELRELC